MQFGAQCQGARRYESHIHKDLRLRIIDGGGSSASAAQDTASVVGGIGWEGTVGA